MCADLPIRTDVLVIGAGPAGAGIASRLAIQRTVVLVDARPAPSRRIGECLPGAARVALQDLGVWPAFAAQAHRPAWCRASCWGGHDIAVRDGLADPHGPGWHLDRAAFDALVVEAACMNGARLLRPARVRGFERVSNDAQHPWRVTLETVDGVKTLACRFLVDASGRANYLARRAGVGVARADRLLCLHAWLRPSAPPVAASLLEAAPDGWWYSAGMPDGSRLVAWHTDADLPAARAIRDVDALLDRARSARLLGPCCEGAQAAGPLCAVPAHTQWPAAAAGQAWLAVGDASLAVDPLASQGLLHSLVTACDGARAIAASLDGDHRAMAGWTAHIFKIRDRYCAQAQAFYGLERRWSDKLFWRRRQRADWPAPAEQLPPGRSLVQACAPAAVANGARIDH
jgi:2-polyprenyl-6-methoxyphenol hydroxylase-like FAD-dependent oxidoreductase